MSPFENIIIRSYRDEEGFYVSEIDLNKLSKLNVIDALKHLSHDHYAPCERRLKFIAKSSEEEIE